jgi:hypothetical protein
MSQKKSKEKVMEGVKIMGRQDREIDYFEIRQWRSGEEKIHLTVSSLRPGVTERVLRENVLLKLQPNDVDTVETLLRPYVVEVEQQKQNQQQHQQQSMRLLKPLDSTYECLLMRNNSMSTLFRHILLIDTASGRPIQSPQFLLFYSSAADDDQAGGSSSVSAQSNSSSADTKSRRVWFSQSSQ